MIALLRKARASLTGMFGMLSLFLVAACAPGAGTGIGTAANTGPAVDTSQPVRVAMLLPYGSGQATDTLVARNLENAARLALRDVQGARIDLKVYNTAGSAAQASQMATQAIDEGAKIILGPLYAQAANAAGLAAAARGVNVLAFSNNTEIAGGNVFLLGQTFDNTARRLASYATSRGKSNILVVHSEDAAGDLGRRAIQQAVQNARGRLAGTVGYPRSQQGITAAAPQIAAAATRAGADAIFLTAGPESDLPFLAQLLPEQGLTSDKYQYMGLSRWDSRPALFASKAIQGGWFTLPDQGRVTQFEQRYRAAYGDRPHPLAGLGYDGIAAIGAMLRGGRSSALSTRSITQGAGFAGVYGAFRFRPDGGNQRALAVAQIQGNSVVVIDPAPNSFRGAGF